MESVVHFTRTGPPAVMRLEATNEQQPGPGEAWIEQEAIGVNYLDIQERSGTAKIPLPSGLGYEAAGRVTAIGAGADGVEVGDRVAYAGGPRGAYASGRLYPAERLVRIPDQLTADDAAAILFKGITAQYLIKSTYPVGPDKVMVLYGPAGAVGQIMVPWAKHLGAFVIGVVSKESQIPLARSLGCDVVLIWGAGDLPSEVDKASDGRKADVVYDAIGRMTFQASVDSLRPRGMLVSFGSSSGQPPPVEMATLNAKGSLFVTRPSISVYAADAEECRARARDLFAAAAEGIVKPYVWKSFPLDHVAEAHAAYVSGESSGAIILRPLPQK
jgi:NADPH2:quinone reductase